MQSEHQSYDTVRRIYNVMMDAIDRGAVPDGRYGKETCRWATLEETKALGLASVPLEIRPDDDRHDNDREWADRFDSNGAKVNLQE